MAVLHIRRKNLRRSFGKTKEIVSLPDLIEVQSRSFNNFVQLDYLPNERNNIGLERVLRNVFPIEQGDRFSLNYSGYELGDWSCICGLLVGIENRYSWKSKSGKKVGVSRLTKEELEAGAQYIRCTGCHSRVTIKIPYTVDECAYGGRTYALPLRIKLDLVAWDLEAGKNEAGERQVKEVKEQTVFVCSLPMMVEIHNDADGNVRAGDKGTFIINGVHRVVVSQIHRAPGVLFSHVKKTKGTAYANFYGARIIPSRGAWLDFDFDHSGVLYVRIDKKKKILATTFLQALGIKREELLYKFYDVIKVEVNKGKYSVVVNESLCGMRVGSGILAFVANEALTLKLELKKGVRLTKEIVEKLKKGGIVSLPISRDILLGKSSVGRVENPLTGESLLETASIIDQHALAELDKLSNSVVEILGDTLNGDTSCLINTLAHDNISDVSVAAREVYGRIKPGDVPSVKVMEEYIKSMLFNPKYYDLTSVGRLRINRKFGLNVPLDSVALNLEDILATVRYLINLQEKGEGAADDIDELSNRCVRLVDELLQVQAYLGFSRIEKIAREKLRLVEGNISYMPYDFINVKPMAAVLGAFFGTGQLSQFMDQTNPLSEMAHKRRLSALGHGGITRERATLDVRDVHPSHYGKICPVETPDGHNIGLISSLSIYSKVNELGFIETVYRPVKDGIVNGSNVKALDAFQERGKIIGQAAIKISAAGEIKQDLVLARRDGDYVQVSPSELDYIDVSTKQIVSVATALIPFLEHDDANRALMGSNMQRQAVPLISPRSPLVGTGVERDIASSEGICILAKRSGVVTYVSSDKVIISADKLNSSTEEWALSNIDLYELKKYGKSSHNTWIHYRPVVHVGDIVGKGALLADGPSVDNGELSLGNNICVAFMPWNGYNFEDAIVVSKRLVTEDLFSSVHLEEFVVEARDTKLGAEEITRDIPNISERELEILDEDGIVRIGTRVNPGDILVAKATLKGDVQVSPEEKLLRAIFGDKSREVRDTSERVPPGVSGTVVDVRVFSRGGVRKDKRYKDFVTTETEKIEALYAVKFDILLKSLADDLIVEANKVSFKMKELDVRVDGFEAYIAAVSSNSELKKYAENLQSLLADKVKILQAQKKEQISRLRRGDDLPSGVLKTVRVYVAMRRPISVGDKMAGRHGNKGVVSKVVDIEDMPYLADGTPVDIVLNPLGVPARMNLGVLLETMLGMACNKISQDARKNLMDYSLEQSKLFLEKFVGNDVLAPLLKEYGDDAVYDLMNIIGKEGLKLGTPVFDGADFENEIVPLLKDAGLAPSGKTSLFDGRTGDQFFQQVTVGYIYMMKLNHMADDKLHARSVGPYSLITQQPLGGKAQFGGQRLGEMEGWALFGYGAAFALREMITIKSDDIAGRVKAFEAIVHGEEIGETGLPESFNVLIKELQSLGLSVDLFQANEERFCE